MRVKRNLLAAAIGASLVWFGDPRQGARRRHRARIMIDRYLTVVRRTHRAPEGVQMQPQPPTLSDVLAAAERTGIRADFMAEGGKLVCSACNTASEPSTLPREWVHRLEGTSDPDELLTVSALQCPACGTKGVLVMPYGPAADEIEAEIARHLQTPRHADMAPLDDRRVTAMSA